MRNVSGRANLSVRRDYPRNVHQAGKMLVPLLAVLAAIAMVGVGVVAVVLQQEREKLQAKERELQFALAENEQFKKQLEDTQQAKAQVDAELGTVRTRLSASEEELAKAREEREALTRSVEDRQQEVDRLAKELEQTRSEAQNVSTKLTSLQSERDVMNQRLGELERAKNELESKVLELSGQPSVELDKILVGSGAGAAAAQPSTGMAAPSGAEAKGKIMIIDREYDFVIISLGKRDGVVMNQEFQVVRGDQTLGRIKVEQVHDELSAAAILPDSRKDDIREGDVVSVL